ncbi:MAG: TlpA family protein disulfide reductase [Rhodospirillales bacterium]|nr:MAG: TlpA family protein disulfide reductase [Rhodospirillales bacterium]
MTWLKPSLLLVLLALLGCDSSAPPLKMDEPARPFSAQSLDGHSVDVPGDTAGKVTVIRFWADWCPFCKKELTDIEKVWNKNKGKGLLVLAVNAGQGKEKVASFAASLGLTYPVLLDEESRTTRLYGVTGLPATFILDREGRLKAKILGAMDEASFRKAVEDLL